MLEQENGIPVGLPVLHTAVPNWSAGDTTVLGADVTLRVVEGRSVDDEQVLVIEPGSSQAE